MYVFYLIELGDSLEVSKSILNENCIIDSTFNDVQMIAAFLQCNTSHLLFKSIHIHDTLFLQGESSVESKDSMVSFDKLAKFYYQLPKAIKFVGTQMNVDNVYFDLENVNLDFTCIQNAILKDIMISVMFQNYH